jgi:hypothetical protein
VRKIDAQMAFDDRQTAVALAENPLRDNGTAVQHAQYQEPAPSDFETNPFVDDEPPTPPPTNGRPRWQPEAQRGYQSGGVSQPNAIPGYAPDGLPVMQDSASPVVPDFPPPNLDNYPPVSPSGVPEQQVPGFNTPQTVPPRELSPEVVSPQDFVPQNSVLDQDPLDAPELPPAPGSGAPSPSDAMPSMDSLQLEDDQLRSNPFDDDLDSQDDEFDLGESLDQPLPDPTTITEDISCNELRDRLLSRPLSSVSLDVSPKYGEGMASIRGDDQDLRMDLAASTVVRTWTNYRGEQIASGRLIDLRNDRVILDVNGREREISLHVLSDVDVAYVGETWNIPLRCGIGNATYASRSFVPASVQWKAPGHCHKPLYFEQPQLERYGHDAGPIVQPLVSTAHFFANIAVLPYKMGIHPPHECQYSLGYIRPGNCAPYMLQPIPISLRGAALQAGAITGAAALIP